MRKKLNPAPTGAHRKFAWLPVVVLDRKTGTFYKVQFEFVIRKVVSFQGTLVWSYELIEPSINPYDFGA